MKNFDHVGWAAVNASTKEMLGKVRKYHQKAVKDQSKLGGVVCRVYIGKPFLELDGGFGNGGE